MEMNVEEVLAELTARIDALEDIVEELRYAGPTIVGLPEDDYDYYTEGEWDTL